MRPTRSSGRRRLPYSKRPSCRSSRNTTPRHRRLLSNRRMRRLSHGRLGASRGVRAPNPLTGFDAEDNVAMHLLRPELLWPTSFIDFPAFVQRLREDQSEFISGLRDLLQRNRPDLLGASIDIRELTVEV